MFPKKVESFYKVTKVKESLGITVGKIECCGEEKFDIRICGKMQKNLFNNIYLLDDGEQMGMIATCENCKREIEVFNSLTDGYDSYFDENGDLNSENGDLKSENEDLKSENEFRSFKCKKCNSQSFSVRIEYEYPDDLDELGMGNCDGAFTCIWIDLKCNVCGKKYKKIIDYDAT